MKTFGISNVSYWGDQVEDVAAGDTLYLADLVIALYGRGITTYWMQDDLDKGFPIFKGMKAEHRKYAYNALLQTGDSLPRLDYLFVQWRWNQPQKQSNDFKRQAELLEFYSKQDTQIFILDADYKMTAQDEKDWPDATILEVSKTPKKLTRDRTTIFWPFNFEELKTQEYMVHAPVMHDEINTYPLDPNFKISYIGNDYERDNQFKKYVDLVSEELDTGTVHVYGNWLKYPEKIKRNKKEYPFIVFHPKVTREAMQYIYSKSLCVPLLSKDEYATNGMMACRIYEVMYNGSIPVGFEEFKGIEHYLIPDLIVKESHELVDLVKRLESHTHTQRLELWKKQINHFTYSAADFLYDIKII